MNTESTKEAFSEIVSAMATLSVAKAKLANIYSHLKQRDDTQFVLDNLGQYCTPSDDAHEVLFERLHAAKEAAVYASREDERRLLQEQLASAYLAVERAYKALKQ